MQIAGCEILQYWLNINHILLLHLSFSLFLLLFSCLKIIVFKLVVPFNLWIFFYIVQKNILGSFHLFECENHPINHYNHDILLFFLEIESCSPSIGTRNIFWILFFISVQIELKQICYFETVWKKCLQLFPAPGNNLLLPTMQKVSPAQEEIQTYSKCKEHRKPNNNPKVLNFVEESQLSTFCVQAELVVVCATQISLENKQHQSHPKAGGIVPSLKALPNRLSETVAAVARL